MCGEGSCPLQGSSTAPSLQVDRQAALDHWNIAFDAHNLIKSKVSMTQRFELIAKGRVHVLFLTCMQDNFCQEERFR